MPINILNERLSLSPMATYLSNTMFSITTFPLLALICTLPYMIYEYRRFGSIPFWKTFAVYAFLFYITTAYYMVILPLPADHTIVYSYAQTPQLVLGNCFTEIAETTSFSLMDPSTWIPTLKAPDVYELLFNLILTAPLGIFLRYFLHRPWWQTLIIAGLTALFFECSQLSGLFGIYAHPYRLFDVDDLWSNTLGVMIGFWLEKPLCRFLPDINEINEQAIERSSVYTSFTHRLLAFFIDCVCAGALSVIIHSFIPEYNDDLAWLESITVASVLVFMLFPSLLRGATPGQKICYLRIVRPDGTRARWYQICARYGVLVGIAALAPLWLLNLLPDEISSTMNALFHGCIIGYYVVWISTIIVRALRSAAHHPFILLSGIMSNTRVMSLSQIRRKQSGKEGTGHIPGGTINDVDDTNSIRGLHGDVVDGNSIDGAIHINESNDDADNGIAPHDQSGFSDQTARHDKTVFHNPIGKHSAERSTDFTIPRGKHKRN